MSVCVCVCVCVCFVKDFSGTTAPKTLNFSNKIFSQISRRLGESESLDFVYTLRVAKYKMRKKTKMLRIPLFQFSFFPSFTR